MKTSLYAEPVYNFKSLLNWDVTAGCQVSVRFSGFQLHTDCAAEMNHAGAITERATTKNITRRSDRAYLAQARLEQLDRKSAAVCNILHSAEMRAVCPGFSSIQQHSFSSHAFW